MNPSDFIDFASKLAAGSGGAAEYRSAASRAYYGAYNLAMQFLNGMSHFFPKSQQKKSKHEWVQRVLMESKIPEALELGRLLQDAQEDRTGADYDLDDNDQETQPFATKCALRAERIKAKFEACKEPALYTEIRTAITNYRRIIREIQ